MRKRSGKRINKSLLVDISHDGFEQMGVTINISRRGMCIATTAAYPAQTDVTIWIAAADDIFKLKGQVVWNMEKENERSENVPVGLGIKIRNSGPEYMRFVSSMIRKKAAKPVDGSAAKEKRVN
jgi:hypothetical protein